MRWGGRGAVGRLVWSAGVLVAAGVVGAGGGGPGSVAVGADGQGRHGEEGTVAAVWISSDGATWQRVAYDEPVLGARGSGGLIAASAVGTVDAHHLDDPRWWPAAVWTSRDGRAWSRRADAASAARRGSGAQVAAAEGHEPRGTEPHGDREQDEQR